MTIGLGMITLQVAGYPPDFNLMIETAGLIAVPFNDSIVVLAALRVNPRSTAGEPQAIDHQVSGCTQHILSTTLTSLTVPLSHEGSVQPDDLSG